MNDFLVQIHNCVRKYPNRIACKMSSESITYSELWHQAVRYANALRRQGSTPVILYDYKSINYVIAMLACIIANRTYIPVGLCTPFHRLKKIIDLTKSSLVLTSKKTIFDNCDCLTLSDLNNVTNCSAESLTNDIVYIIFTSGSTGEPKGVPISKENLNNFITWISNLSPLCIYKNINVFNQAAFSFDLSVADLYYSLCNGHTLILSSDDIYDNLDEMYDSFDDVNLAVMTPTFMKMCLLNKSFNECNYPNFDCVYFCGERLENNLVKKLHSAFPTLTVINAYGPTEATSAVSAIVISDDDNDLPVGDINNFATEIEIIDDEIVLKGKSVFSGYLGKYIGGYYKEQNINCYKTGDLGYIKNGKLYCKGRIDNQIKYSGYRIELSDIENNMLLIAGVRECVVVPKYNDDGIIKSLIAYVVADDLDTITIKEELKKYIPQYMIPKTIRFIDRIPVNHNGKIDRMVLINNG